MERIHIAFFGPTNSGKSTLVNTLAGQEVSLVSPVPGTTTDPVRKAIEIPGLGPCVLIDTAGIGDTSALGDERKRLTENIIDTTDAAVVLEPDQAGMAPFLKTLRKAEVSVIPFRAGDRAEDLPARIRAALPREEERFLTGNLVLPGDTVLLVMPQDSEAPKGRLILPQVQVIRELLDRGCLPCCCTPDTLRKALERKPDLVITDSQVFREVNEALSPDIPLTSFSILLAAAKGDISVFVDGARAIDTLKPGDRVLIAEACTHVPATEDIGRVKIPALLERHVSKVFPESESDKTFRRHFSAEKSFRPRSQEKLLQIDISAGNDFPEDLSPYALIIHCGACVATSKLVRARTRKALLAGVPITNYGIALAELQGILDRVQIPSLRSE